MVKQLHIWVILVILITTSRVDKKSCYHLFQLFIWLFICTTTFVQALTHVKSISVSISISCNWEAGFVHIDVWRVIKQPPFFGTHWKKKKRRHWPWHIFPFPPQPCTLNVILTSDSEIKQHDKDTRVKKRWLKSVLGQSGWQLIYSEWQTDPDRQRLTWYRRQRLLVNVILAGLSIRLQTQRHINNESQPHV